MSTIAPYKDISIVQPDPTGEGGLLIQNNFKKLADDNYEKTTQIANITANYSLKTETQVVANNLAAEITARSEGDNIVNSYANTISGNLQFQITNIIEDGSLIKTNSITGSIFRTLHDRFSDAVFVEDFGAIGDGIEDDTTALQNAINFSSTYKKNVILNNNYKITSPISINNNDVYISGMGAIITSHSTAIVFSNDVDNITINGLNISSDATSTTSYALIESLGNQLTNINILNNKLSIPNAENNAIHFVCESVGKALNYINISNNKFFNIGRMGIELQNHAVDSEYRLNNIKINNNEFLSCGLSSIYGMGISVSGLGKDLLISYNTFNDCVFSDIEVVGSSNAIVSNNLGFNHERGASAFSVSGLTQTKMIFSNNIFLDCTNQNNFYNVNECIINGNYIENISASNMFRCNDSKITNNIFKTKHYSCVQFDDGANNELINNTFDNSNSSDNYSVVRFYSASAHNNKVINCKFGLGSGGGYYDSIAGANNNFFINNYNLNGNRLENIYTFNVESIRTIVDYLCGYDTFVFTGNISSSTDITFDRVEKVINIKNETNNTLNIAHATGTGTTLTSGKNAIVASTYDNMIPIIIS